MKKTFKLHIEGKNSDRVLESIKHQVNKYIKRERRKQLPPHVDYWDFNCRFGVVEAEAEVVHLAEIRKKMDEVSRSGGDSFYVEILATPGIRKRHPAGHVPARFSEDDDE